MSPLLSRDEQLASLGRPLDVLVIGGGITGAGVALDAVTRGYRVGLVEQADFASGTSSRSTKLIHGGIRYLARGELKLVGEALRERARLLRLAPHLVRPQPFLIPLYEGLTRPLGVAVAASLRPAVPWGVRAALWAYDRLAQMPTMRHRRLTVEDAVSLVPALSTTGLRAAFLFYDARTDDVRLTLGVLALARRFGAATANYAQVRSLAYAQNRVSGARVEDRLTSRTLDVRARHVVNATGVWAERVAAMDGAPPFRIRPSKGAHLVLRGQVLPSETAVVIPQTDDGRLAFLVPWSGRVILGTTDDRYDGGLDTAAASEADVTFLLRQANRVLRQQIDVSDVLGIYAGLRPLVEGGGSSGDLPREHAVVESAGGLVSIVGGKLTSYRKMAEDTVDMLAQRDGGHRPCRTRTLPLASAEDLGAAQQALARSGLSNGVQQHLLAAYGPAATEVAAIAGGDPAGRAPLAEDLPVLAAEVVYACRHEMALTLADMMFLRTRLSILCEDGGAGAVSRVADLMAGALGWDRAEVLRQRDAWAAMVDRERTALRISVRGG